jgi:hypothetical protein
MKTTTKVQKTVQVLATYKFKQVQRICFTVLSSNGNDKYHTCFQGDGRESCDCPAGLKGRKCYHVEQLRERAQSYFQSKQQADSPVVAPQDQIVNIQIGSTTISEPISNLGNAVAHHIWAKRLLAGVQEEPARKAEREARLQREADEMIACASRKYDAPLNGCGGFQLMR